MNMAAWFWAITSASSASVWPSPPREVALTKVLSRFRPALAASESSAPVHLPSAPWVATSPPASHTNETPSYQYWLGKYSPEKVSGWPAISFTAADCRLSRLANGGVTPALPARSVR